MGLLGKKARALDGLTLTVREVALQRSPHIFLSLAKNMSALIRK